MVEQPTTCRACGGTGKRAYGSTATWRAGVGGQMVTEGTCNRCWGSGDEARPGPDLRRQEGLERARAWAAKQVEGE